jgi:hypothetical protein
VFLRAIGTQRCSESSTSEAHLDQGWTHSEDITIAHQHILGMIQAFNAMPLDLTNQIIGDDQEWEYMGVKFNGDCGGEELEGLAPVRIKDVYKRRTLRGPSHGILCGNGDGSDATMRFLNQYISGKGLVGRVGVDFYEKAMEKRFARERERSRSPKRGTSSGQ